MLPSVVACGGDTTSVVPHEDTTATTSSTSGDISRTETSTGETTAVETTTTTAETEATETSTSSTTGELGTSESTGDTGDAEPWSPTCPPPFVAPWDDCFSPWPGTCDVYAQDCGAGEKCTYVLAESAISTDEFETRCVPIADAPVASGEPCTSDGVYTGIDDCDATSFCVGMRPGAEHGTCTERARCGESCATAGAFAFRNGQPAYCAFACDPFMGDAACPLGFACQPPIGSYDDFHLYAAFVCQPDMTWWYREVGGCSGTTCATGSICGNWADDGAGLQCLALCSLDGDPVACAADRTCRPWADVFGPSCAAEPYGSCGPS